MGEQTIEATGLNWELTLEWWICTEVCAKVQLTGLKLEHWSLIHFIPKLFLEMDIGIMCNSAAVRSNGDVLCGLNLFITLG